MYILSTKEQLRKKQVRQQDTNPPYGGALPWEGDYRPVTYILESRRRADVKL